MRKKKLSFLATTLTLAVLLSLSVGEAQADPPQLLFETPDVPYSSFLVSYDGDGGPLVGSTIPIAEVRGVFTSQNSGVSLEIVNGSLDFFTGPNRCENCVLAYPYPLAINYLWYPHFGEYTLTGTILDGSGNELFTGVILTGTFVYWSDRVAFYPFLSEPLGIAFAGNGLDEMATELASFYGFNNNTFESNIFIPLCNPPGSSASRDSTTLAYSCNNGSGSITSRAIPELESNYNVLKLISGEEHDPPYPTTSDFYGQSVSISGEYAIVGAPGAGNVPGSPPIIGHGGAYILERSSSGWTQVSKLEASDGDDYDAFGFSVSISGDTVIVGAPGDDLSQGSAYIFKDNGSGWTPVTKLTDSGLAADDEFGWSVSISGDTIIVGSPGDDSSQGSAYIFKDNGSGWNQVAKLTASDGAAGDDFGMTVAISGDYTIIGARNGSAYIFERNSSGLWPATETDKLTASDGVVDDLFGQSVSISGDTAIVGARGWPYSTLEGPAVGPGAAYIFERDGSGNWNEVVPRLIASDGERGDNFGESVSISGGYVVVGAPYDEDKGPASGSAYIFEKCAGSWTQIAKMTAYDAIGGELFGYNVSNSGDTTIVGMPGAGGLGPRPVVGSAYIYYRLPLGDSDSDGIEDSIDDAPTTFSDAFTDSNTPTATSGTITNRGGLRLAVTDETAPDGVRITATASCGTSPATVSVCGGSATFTLYDGNEVLVTCGSVTIKNISGPPVVINFEAEDGTQATATLEEDNALTFEPTTFTITAPATNSAPTVVTVGEDVITITPGSEWPPPYVTIDGCDTGVVNEEYEGQYISQRIDDCASGAKNHGKFVSCVAKLTNKLKKTGLITGAEKGAIQSCAAHADIP